MVVLKAMGMECDQEIVQLIGYEDDIAELLSPSLEEPYNIGVYSRDQVRCNDLLWRAFPPYVSVGVCETLYVPLW